MNLFALLLKEQSEAEEAAKKVDDTVSEILKLAKEHGKFDDSFLDKFKNPVYKEKIEKIIQGLAERPYEKLSPAKKELFDFVLEGLTPENTFGQNYKNESLRLFVSTRSPLSADFDNQIPSFREGSPQQQRLQGLRDGLPNTGTQPRSVPTIDDIDDLKSQDPTLWSAKNIDDLVDDYIKNNPGITDDLKEVTRSNYKAYLEYLKSGKTGVTTTGKVGGTIRELGLFKASDGLEYDVSKLLNTFEPLELAPDTPPPPPPLDAVKATTAAADDAAKATTAAADDAAKPILPYRTIGDEVLEVFDSDLNPSLPDPPNRVVDWAQRAKNAYKVGLTQNLIKQQLLKPGPVAGALGYGGDLAVRTGMDVYAAETNPQWAYGLDSEGNELTYGSVFSEIPINIATSTAAGAAIGGAAGLLGGPASPMTVPAGAVSGAVMGFVGSLATTLKDIVQAPVRIGYGKEGSIQALKSNLQTAYELQKNNPKYDYSDSILALRNAIERQENEYGFERGLGKVLDTTVGSAEQFRQQLRQQVFGGDSKSGEELKAEAEAAFAERYPQGISGGLVPGKSANDIEKEAADMILSRLNKGPNDRGPNNQGASSPEDLAREFGWETEEEQKVREELINSDPEKYGKMSEKELRDAAKLKIVNDRHYNFLRGSKETTDKQDAEYQARLKVIEDEVAKKELEIADKRKMDDLTHQQKMDALAINTGLAKEKLDRTKKELEDRGALFIAGEESKKRRKEEERAKEKAVSDAAKAKRKKEFDAKMAQMDKSIAEFDAQMGSYDTSSLPIASRRSRYGNLVSDGEGWGT